LLPLTTVEKNLETKMKTCEEKIKSIEVSGEKRLLD